VGEYYLDTNNYVRARGTSYFADGSFKQRRKENLLLGSATIEKTGGVLEQQFIRSFYTCVRYFLASGLFTQLQAANYAATLNCRLRLTSALELC
jgi:hypothetical protein